MNITNTSVLVSIFVRKLTSTQSGFEAESTMWNPVDASNQLSSNFTTSFLEQKLNSDQSGSKIGNQKHQNPPRGSTTSLRLGNTVRNIKTVLQHWTACVPVVQIYREATVSTYQDRMELRGCTWSGYLP